jgi:hypothetical protein
MVLAGWRTRDMLRRYWAAAASEGALAAARRYNPERCPARASPYLPRARGVAGNGRLGILGTAT